MAEKKKSKKKKDELGQVREVGKKGFFIANHDYGEGPYSQSDGKPYNAKGEKAASVYDAIDSLSNKFYNKANNG